MPLITRNAKENRSMTAQLMSQDLFIVSGPFGFFCVLGHPNHFVLAGATIEKSSLLTDSSRPLFKQIEIFSMLTVWLYISTVSTFLKIRASNKSASSGFRLLGEIPAGAKTPTRYQNTKHEKLFFQPEKFPVLDKWMELLFKPSSFESTLFICSYKITGPWKLGCIYIDEMAIGLFTKRRKKHPVRL